MMQDNIIGRRRILAGYIADGTIDERVLNLLIPNGSPLDDEDYFWDFKSELPIQSTSPTPESKDSYAAKMAEIVKDAVSFYNTYGGYLVVGVDDKSLEIHGFNKEFDVNDLCKKIHGATRETIDVKFRRLFVEVNNKSKEVGLLYIPRRPTDKDPVQFIKDARESKSTGRKAYTANEIYMRSREECRAATTAADFSLLFKRERYSSTSFRPKIRTYLVS